jgi:hypothetical protein
VPEIHSCAARLGQDITEWAIRLEITKLNAESFVLAARDYLGEEDLPSKIPSFLALLSLRARDLVDAAAKKSGTDNASLGTADGEIEQGGV